MAAAGTAPWPASLHELAAVLGEEAVQRLVAKCGGQDLYVSTKRRDYLAEVLGSQAAADRLLEVYAGETIEVPNCKAGSAVKAAILVESGPPNAVAQRLGCTARWVRKVRAAASEAS